MPFARIKVVVRADRGPVDDDLSCVTFSAGYHVHGAIVVEVNEDGIFNIADGTGVRDWGEAAGLWPWQQNSLAWSDWPGAKWDGRSPFDNKLPWGLCSSKY